MLNRNYFPFFILLLSILISTYFFPSPSYAIEILLEPASIQRVVGGKARVRVYATSAEDLISMGFKVSFNPLVVQVENAAKYEDFYNGWLMDADGNPETTDDQYTKPFVEVDNDAGTVAMMGGRLIGENTTGLNGKVLLGFIDFVAVGSGNSELTVDRFAYHPNHPNKTFDNFVKLNKIVDEPTNLPGTIGGVYIGDDACECDLNFDGSCNFWDYQIFIAKWGANTCQEPIVYCACDLNNDGRCNFWDYQLFIRKWGNKSCPIFP